MNNLGFKPLLRKQSPLRGFVISREELVKLFRLLQTLAQDAGQREIAAYHRQENQTEDDFKNICETAVSLFRPYVVIETDSGATTTQASEAIFDSPDFPTNVSKINFDTGVLYNWKTKTDPQNRIFVSLDFRTISSKGFAVQPAQETPNESCIVTIGQDDTWVRAAHSRIEGFFSDKRRGWTWIHNAGVYDFFLMTIGIAFVAWVLTSMVPLVDTWFAQYSKIYVYSGYIFFFLMSLRLFMFMFDYARKIWPLSELRGDNKTTILHRFIWGSLLLGVIAGVIKDLIH